MQSLLHLSVVYAQVRLHKAKPPLLSLQKYMYIHVALETAFVSCNHCGSICDPLSENPSLWANIEFELEAILSITGHSQLNSDYYTNVSQGLGLYHAEL